MKFLRNKKVFFFGILFFIVLLLVLVSEKKNDANIAPAQFIQEQKDEALVQEAGRNVSKLRGDRYLGMGISEGSIGFENSFRLAKSVGTEVVEIPVMWDISETRPKQYDDGWLAIANQYYPKAGVRIAISLNPIDTNNAHLPKDLQGKSFDDSEVIDRYKAFVDFAADTVSDSDVYFVSIGNEVDIYLGNSDSRWREYSNFFSSVAPYVRAKFPHAVVGSKMTYNGIVSENKKAAQIINDSDIVLVTYYPFLPGGFMMRDPQTVHNDFRRIVNAYPQRRIYFAEIGYPSGKENGSSEEWQASFIHETFSAWDDYADRIPFMNFQWMHDASKEKVADWQKYYGFENSGFASYLGTLGLRTYDGKDKQSFIQLQKEVQQRQWQRTNQ